MKKKSAGILLFRRQKARIEVLLVHPGGPFWKNKDEGAWSIPKGEFNEEEEPLDAALREFEEETGGVAAGAVTPLEPVPQSGGKIVYAFAIEGDFDPAMLKSNTFTLEWPPKSGKQQEFPEVDQARWFSIDEAETKINKAQVAFLRQLEQVTRSPHRS